MVMRNDDMMNVRERNAILEKVFFQRTQTHPNIDYQGIGVSSEQVAITAAATSERYEFKHLRSKNRAKLRKSV